MSDPPSAWVGRYDRGAWRPPGAAPTGRPPRLAAADVPRFRDALRRATPEDGVCTFRCQDVRRILEEEFGVSCAGRRSMTWASPGPRQPDAPAPA